LTKPARKEIHGTFMEDCCIALVFYSCMCIITGTVAIVYDIVDNIEVIPLAKQEEEVDTVTTTQPN
jgi:hypothetical protein